MHFKTLFFDLDATLYSTDNGLWDLIRERIYRYMREQVGLPADRIQETRDHYWRSYGTTLEGLRRHHQVDPAHYLNYVHDLPLEKYLEPDDCLRKLLSDLPQDLWVFTNADHLHASRVLAALEIGDLFQGIVDLLAMDYAVKPQPQAYQIALSLASVTDPESCMLFDDLIPNLAGAKEFGFTTALVGNSNGNDLDPAADYYLPAIHDIKTHLPWLWNGG